jgi:hypothetical protein
MTRHEMPSVGVRDVLRWWPLVLIPAVIAVAGALWTVSHQAPSYTAVTRLAVVPLVQWDETFLGTSLLRDGGDAKTTAATTAERLNSLESIDDVVTVSAVPDTNVIEITARSSNPRAAEQVSEEFAKATLAERWRTISAELDARIAAVAATTAADPNAGEASARLQTLILVRQAGSDPTLKIDSTGPAVEDKRLPVAIVVGLAAVGGASVGLLTAMAAARWRRRQPAFVEPVASPQPEPACQR